MSKKKRAPARAQVRPPIPRSPPPSLLHLGELQRLVLIGYKDEDLRRSLSNDGLVDVDDGELAAVRAALHPPKVFRPLDPKHKASSDFLASLGLLELVRDTAEAKEARAVLRDRRARELAEAGAVLAVPVHAVRLMLRQLYQHAASAAGLGLFYSSFFNVGALSRSELRLAVERHVKSTVLRGVREEDLPAAKRAVRQDARMTALALPATSAGWSGVLATLGWMPPPQDLAVVVGQLEQLAASRAVQAAFRNGRDDARRAESYSRVLAQALELKQQVVDPNTVLLQKLRSVSLRTAPERIPTIDELAGVNHTVDLNPPNRVDDEPAAAESEPASTGTE